MIPKAINDFRCENGARPVEVWNKKLNDRCLLHTSAMIHRGKLYHTPTCYLEDYREIVGACSFLDNYENTARSLIFDYIGKSPEHKKILLECNEMGYGDETRDGNLIITIRGK